jgi:2-keto-4-pentenoate hydratase
MPERSTEKAQVVLAQRLDEAWEGRTPIPPPSESGILQTVEQAYSVQSGWTEMRLGRGDWILGRKIGLTSLAMQEQLGVDEPDYGTLWGSRYFPTQNGHVEIPSEPFLQPRLEGELAFLIDKPLVGPSVTAEEVLVATEALAVAAEIIDSRIEDWRITLIDTVADNASYGGFTRGDWSKTLLETNLRRVGMSIERNGELVVEGNGADVLGHPARAVAWLANKLASFGVSLEPGDVVLSGSVGKAAPASRGDEFVLRTSEGLSLSVTFT